MIELISTIGHVNFALLQYSLRFDHSKIRRHFGQLSNVIILENQTELFLRLDAIVSTIVMTFRTDVDSHQKKQRFIVTILIVLMQ